MTTLQDILRDCRLILPELTLAATLCIVLLTDVMVPRAKSHLTGWIALAGLAVALLLVFRGFGDNAVFAASAGGGGPLYAFSETLVVDKLSDFFKVVFLLGAIGVVLFSIFSVELKDYRYGEYYTLLLGSVLGGSLLVSSNNFILLVLALETLSLTSYVLVGYLKHNRSSSEASLKYILYGSVATGVMLFGISYIYGMAGSLDIDTALVGVTQREDNALGIMIAFILVMGGMGFKIAAAPFHFWAPDVYQGAPTPITAFLAVVSKAAGFGALFRVLLPLFAVEGAVVPDEIAAVRGALTGVIEQAHLPLLFWLLAAVTMTTGNLIALRQTNVKRLLAYSSIAHVGYVLMGFTVFNNAALEAMLFYIFVYLFMNLGAFLVVVLVMNKTGSAELEAYRGLAWRNPFLFVMMFVFLISLTGIPPTAGFVGKFKLFEVVIFAGLEKGVNLNPTALFYLSLALIAGVNTVVSLYYYMKIAKTMVFESPADETALPMALFERAYLLAYAAPVLLIFVLFGAAFSVVRLFPG